MDMWTQYAIVQLTALSTVLVDGSCKIKENNLQQ